MIDGTMKLTNARIQAQQNVRLLFECLGLLSGWASKENILAGLPRVMKAREYWQRVIPKYVLGNFFDQARAKSCAEVLTFARRLARYAEFAVVRRKWQQRIDGVSRTIYYYRVLMS